jgi:hypothetical protein
MKVKGGVDLILGDMFLETVVVLLRAILEILRLDGLAHLLMKMNRETPDLVGINDDPQHCS